MPHTITVSIFLRNRPFYPSIDQVRGDDYCLVLGLYIQLRWQSGSAHNQTQTLYQLHSTNRFTLRSAEEVRHLFLGGWLLNVRLILVWRRFLSVGGDP